MRIVVMVFIMMPNIIFTELVEKRQVDVCESGKGGQLYNGFDFALEQDRQEHDIERFGFAESRTDLDVVPEVLLLEECVVFRILL